MVKARLLVVGLVGILIAIIIRISAVSARQASGVQGAVRGTPLPVEKRLPEPKITFPVEESKPKTISLDGLKGKVVVIDFWATWCQPCRMSVPELAGLYKKYHAQGLNVIGVSIDEPETKAQVPAVAQELGINYPVAYADNVEGLQDEFEFRSIPSMYLIDKQGRIADHLTGYDPGGSLSREIETLLHETG